MKKKDIEEFNVTGLSRMFESVGEILNNYAMNALTLFNYSNTPIDNDNEVIERADAMDMLMDMAKNETDIAMVYAQAISDRIEEYERENLEIQKIPAIEMLKGMMDIKGLKQSNLNHIATQSVISEIISGKRIINIRQAKGFAEFFNLPTESFID